MNGVFIVPTGIGCEIGGHAGDATPAVKLIASVCDKLIVNPNAVNASDINEMPDNCLYVEGSTLDRFLKREIYLKEVKANKILVVTNSPLKNEVVNSVNAARATIGISAEVLVLKTPLKMTATKNQDGTAGGIVEGGEELIRQVRDYNFDALAITSQIYCDKKVAIDYFENGGVNPWGKVEAIASKHISCALDKPVAHSPTESDWIKEERYIPPVSDPRMSAEMVSVSYLHCILKGLWKAPGIIHNGCFGATLFTDQIDFMVSPFGCWGSAHDACQANYIPIIVVRENDTIYKKFTYFGKEESIIRVTNYLEAAGVIKAMDIGIARESITRPLKHTVAN
ncbi:MAG: DUF3326 domain-containing protein [Planctomycetes bacterium]|nr:DUF3326 domain-containing protein [Planctomycetota bacterium]